MASIATYTKSGSKATASAKLDKAIFDVSVENHELLKAAYVAYLANGRENLGRTKTRGEVSGGGKKPWKQKGTGRARFGSSRNPIWRHGGIVFGPTGEENYTKKLTTQKKRQAIRQALSLAANEGSLKVIEDVVLKDGKTKEALSLLAKIEATGKVLLVVPEFTQDIDRASRNITDLKVVTATYLTVFDLLNADTVVISQKALGAIGQWLSPAAAETKDSSASASVKETK